MKNRVHLIAYADRLGGTIAGVTELFRGPRRDCFAGVHVLPFYTPIDGADAGFDPTDHLTVDPRLGTWDDITVLGSVADVMADVIVNHISADSPQFRDVRARGADSPFAPMFLTFASVFPSGASEADLLAIYRPRPGLPFTAIALADGTRHLFWTTFTPKQLDLDVGAPATADYLTDILDRLADSGVTAVRLDAVGYAVKTAGTSCFMTPETFAFIDRLTELARQRGLEVLVEIHAHHEHQLAVAARVDLVYDFALPPLVLHALLTGDGAPLRRWLEIRPRNAVTVLDTHDGIGVVDVGPDAAGRPGLLDATQLPDLVERIHTLSDGGSRLATGAAASNVDLYQVNCTYYDALGRDAARYLLARLLQFFVPGIPQVYYVGLLAGTNDLDLLSRTGVGRDVNRHHYTPPELAEALERPVVRDLLAAIRFRNTHPAFGGTWSLADGPDHVITMTWTHGTASATLTADLAAATFELAFTTVAGTVRVTDLAELPAAG